MKHLLLAMFLSVALIGCSDQGTPEKQSAADISAGKVVADKECKGCHGLDGKGTAAGIPNLAGQRGRYLMASLKEYKDRVRVHAALRTIAATMSEADTRAVAAYYASLPPIPAAKVARFLSLRERQGGGGGLCELPWRGRQQQDPRHAQPRRPAAALFRGGHAGISDRRARIGANGSDAAQVEQARSGKRGAVLRVADSGAAQRAADRRCGSRRTAHRRVRRLSRLARREHGFGNAEPRLRGPAISDASDQGLPHHAQARPDAAPGRRRSAIRTSTISSRSTRRRSRSRRKTGRRCSRTSPTSAIVATPASSDNPALAIPIIGGQDKDYLMLALRAYRDDKRGNSMMHNMSMPYSDSIIESIASYYASRPAK